MTGEDKKPIFMLGKLVVHKSRPNQDMVVMAVFPLANSGGFSYDCKYYDNSSNEWKREAFEEIELEASR